MSKLIRERVVVPVTLSLRYEDRRGARADLLKEVAEILVGQSITGAGVEYGAYSMESVSIGKPRRKRSKA